MSPLSPWELARSADGFARDLLTNEHAPRGADGITVVGGSVLVRAAAILVIVSVIVALVPGSWSPVVALVGIAGPLLYVALYYNSSTPTARSVLLGSFKRGYRITLLLSVLAAGVLIRFVGLRQGWVSPTSAAVPPPLASLLPLVAVIVQTGALRSRRRRLAG